MREKLRQVLLPANIEIGYLYFWVHLLVELASFQFLGLFSNQNINPWQIALIYDAVAFIPQLFIGYYCDKHPKVKIGIIGSIGMILSLMLGLLFLSNRNIVLFCVVLFGVALGNACIHISGARATILLSDGKLSHSALFVAGGSFGVITGKYLSSKSFSLWISILTMLFCLFVIAFVDRIEHNKKDHMKQERNTYRNINIVKEGNAYMAVMIVFFVVCARSYMAYGIPTSWNKTFAKTVLLFVCMGIGKAAGGILSDAFGARRIAILSTCLSIPFLVFGNEHMEISLIGVMLFSMTMSISLAILVSLFPKIPGFAFGITTVGLVVGVLPVFYFGCPGLYVACMMICIVSLLATILLSAVIKKE